MWLISPIAGSPQITTNNLANIQSSNGTEKNGSQPILMLMTVTVSPRSHDQNAGTWQLVLFTLVAVPYHVSCDHHMQLS